MLIKRILYIVLAASLLGTAASTVATVASSTPFTPMHVAAVPPPDRDRDGDRHDKGDKRDDRRDDRHDKGDRCDDSKRADCHDNGDQGDNRGSQPPLL